MASLAKLLLETPHSLHDVLPSAEGRGADEALTTWAEAGSRGRDQVALLKDLGKDIPGLLARETNPNVGGVGAPVDLEA